MAINFPASPSTNDTHTDGNNRWVWNGSSWTKIQASAVTDTINAQNDNSSTTLYPVMVSALGSNQSVKGASSATKLFTFDASDGNLTVGGNISCGGTITYEDVKNVDSIGIVTARTGLKVGTAVTISSVGNITLDKPGAGIVTATKYYGDGSELTGITQVGGATTVAFNDNKPIYFGTDNDYKIYWNNNRMYFQPESSSITAQFEMVSNDQMYIHSKDNGMFLRAKDQNVIDIYGGSGGGIYFSHNATQKLKLEGGNWTYLNNANVTHAGDVQFSGQNYNAFWDKSVNALQFADNAKATWGDHAGAGDLQISHDGSNSTILNTTGELIVRDDSRVRIRTDQLVINSGDNSESIIYAEKNGAVQLYHNNVLKFETVSYGVVSKGSVEIQSGSMTTADSSDSGTTNSAIFGTGSDLKIFHDGSNTYQVNTTGSLVHRSTGEIFLQSDGGIRLTDVGNNETFLKCVDNGTVELYYDNSKKFETSGTGATLTGHLIIDSSSGSAIHIPDGQNLQIGTGHDIKISHNGSNSFFENLTGYLEFQGASNEKWIRMNQNGSVDLYYDNSKKLETRSDGVLVSGNIQLNDSNRLDLGNNGDLRLYHDGSNSYIKDVGTGALYIDGSSVRFRNYANSETMAEFIGDGEVKLYYNNSKKFETKNYGVRFYGTLEGVDNEKVQLGSSGDLQLYHSGSHSYIKDAGTGALIINGNEVLIKNAADNEDILKCTQDAGVDLYYNNVKKFGTRVNGVDIIGNTYIADNDKISFGGSSDLLIYHDGSSNVIETTSNTKIGKSGEASAWFNPDGNVQLFYDNSKKFETNSVGVFVKSTIQIEEASGSEYYRLHTNGYGGLEIQNETTKVCEFTDANTLSFPDNNKIQLGTGDDLKIYHNGSHSRIDNDGTGNLYINAAPGETGISIIKNGSVDLYYDNSKKLETISSGVQVYGDLQLQGGNGDTQSLYWDKSDYILKFKDSINAEWGNSRDLQIWHNGTNSHLENSTNTFYIRSDLFSFQSKTSSEEFISCAKDGAVKLYYDNSTRIETVTDGVKFAGSDNGGGRILPAADNAGYVGESANRWKAVYAVDGSIETSDRNEKNTIIESDLGLDFINELKPVSYKWNRNDGKTHYGLIAQDIEETLGSINKPIDDFGALDKPNDAPMGLNYSGLISPLIKAVQELTTEVNTLKAKVAVLESS